jgi:hypothetical protein
MRSGELLVRRGLIETGLLLMISRRLVERIASRAGFEYRATESAGAFLSALNTPYIIRLKDRAEWIAKTFGNATDAQLATITRRFFDEWSTQFQPVENVRDASS